MERSKKASAQRERRWQKRATRRDRGKTAAAKESPPKECRNMTSSRISKPVGIFGRKMISDAVLREEKADPEMRAAVESNLRRIVGRAAESRRNVPDASQTGMDCCTVSAQPSTSETSQRKINVNIREALNSVHKHLESKCHLIFPGVDILGEIRSSFQHLKEEKLQDINEVGVNSTGTGEEEDVPGGKKIREFVFNPPFLSCQQASSDVVEADFIPARLNAARRRLADSSPDSPMADSPMPLEDVESEPSECQDGAAAAEDGVLKLSPLHLSKHSSPEMWLPRHKMY